MRSKKVLKGEQATKVVVYNPKDREQKKEAQCVSIPGPLVSVKI